MRTSFLLVNNQVLFIYRLSGLLSSTKAAHVFLVYQQVEHINARLFHTYQCVCTYVDTQYLENVVDKKAMELPSQQIACGSK